MKSDNLTSEIEVKCKIFGAKDFHFLDILRHFFFSRSLANSHTSHSFLLAEACRLAEPSNSLHNNKDNFIGNQSRLHCSSNHFYHR